MQRRSGRARARPGRPCAFTPRHPAARPLHTPPEPARHPVPYRQRFRAPRHRAGTLPLSLTLTFPRLTRQARRGRRALDFRCRRPVPPQPGPTAAPHRPTRAPSPTPRSLPPPPAPAATPPPKGRPHAHSHPSRVRACAGAIFEFSHAEEGPPRVPRRADDPPAAPRRLLSHHPHSPPLSHHSHTPHHPSPSPHPPLPPLPPPPSRLSTSHGVGGRPPTPRTLLVVY